MVDAETGRIRWQRPYPVQSKLQEEPHVAFTPSGVLLTSAQHGNTILWDPTTGRIIRRYPIGGLPAISADGRQVALGRNTPFIDPVSSASMSVLDLRTGRYRTLAANLSTAWIRGVSFVAGDFRDRGRRVRRRPRVRRDLRHDQRVLRRPARPAVGDDARSRPHHRHRRLTGRQHRRFRPHRHATPRRAFSWNRPDLSCAGARQGHATR